MYYHLRITTISDPDNDEVKLDLTNDEIIRQYINPYLNNEEFIINGLYITSDAISRIKISQSREVSTRLIEQLKYKDRSSNIVFMGGPSLEWRAAELADDITDDIMRELRKVKKEKSTQISKEKPMSTSKVFIVHGHDEILKNEMETFLYSVKLDPIVLHKKPDEGQTVIEKFEKNADVSFAIILLTPDDFGGPVIQEAKMATEADTSFRARQNVIFEFGYFVGKLGRKNVCCVYKEDIELPSDISGLLYKRIKGNLKSVELDLVKELKAAGLNPAI